MRFLSESFPVLWARVALTLSLRVEKTQICNRESPDPVFGPQELETFLWINPWSSDISSYLPLLIFHRASCYFQDWQLRAPMTSNHLPRLLVHLDMSKKANQLIVSSLVNLLYTLYALNPPQI